MDKNIFIKEKLLLKIYTIGFEPKGESILFTICDGNNILFSGLTDCYIDEDETLIKLLDRLKISNLDYFCITHPDNDHCLGIQRIMDKLSSSTTVVLPSRIFDFTDCYDADVQDGLNDLRLLFNLRKDSKLKPHFITACDNCDILDDWSFIDRLGNEVPLEIKSISPSTNVIEKYAYKKTLGKVSPEHNDFSIINLIKLGNLRVLLTGDVENDEINNTFNNLTRFGKDFFSNKIDFVKIPHHTSLGSNVLLNKIRDNKIGVSVTTIYRSCNLPNYDLFTEYSNVSDYSYCTGYSILSPEKHGIVAYEIDITDSCGVISLFDAAVSYNDY